MGTVLPGSVISDPEQVDTDYRFVVALRANLPSGVATNVASHLSLGLVARAATEAPELLPHMAFLRFPDADGGSHYPVSALSLIVLEGRSAWLRRLRDEAHATDILCTDFTSAMTGDTYVEQLERMSQTSELDLEYYGVGLFARGDELAPLTKKFSLLR